MNTASSDPLATGRAAALGLAAPRWMRVAWLVLAVAGAVLITLLATASANSALFTRYYTELIIGNALIVAGLWCSLSIRSYCCCALGAPRCSARN